MNEQERIIRLCYEYTQDVNDIRMKPHLLTALKSHVHRSLTPRLPRDIVDRVVNDWFINNPLGMHRINNQP